MMKLQTIGIPLKRDEMKLMKGGLAIEEEGDSTSANCRGWVEADDGLPRHYTADSMSKSQAKAYAEQRAAIIGVPGAWGGNTVLRSGWCCASCP